MDHTTALNQTIGICKLHGNHSSIIIIETHRSKPISVVDSAVAYRKIMNFHALIFQQIYYRYV